MTKLSVLRYAAGHVLVDAGLLSDGVAPVLDDATEHHLRRVLRLRDGAAVGVTDGAGRWGLAELTTTGGSVVLEWTSAVQFEAAHSPSITIASAIPKGDRFDWLVQKVTEIGVDRLILVDAERSVVRWKPDRVSHHLARAQRIADEALRQSRRVWRLDVVGPVPAVDVLGTYPVAEPGGRSLVEDDHAVVIGPEGGWSPTELEVVQDRIGLTSTILRTETAAVVAASALMLAGSR